MVKYGNRLFHLHLPPKELQSLAKKQNTRQWFIQTGYVLLLLWPCAELACRLVGAKPYIQQKYSISATPEDCIIPHERYGFALGEGEFEVTINHEHHYKATHKSGCRITSLQDFNSDTLAPVMALFGCSYTYGMGVDDEETFAFKLQHNFRQFQLLNMAVPGYGNLQGCMQLESMIQEGTVPEVAIFVYASFHDERNALLPRYKNSLRLGFLNAQAQMDERMYRSRFPYGVLWDGELIIESVEWTDISAFSRLREYSAAVNFVADFKENIITRKLQPDLVTQAIFGRLKTLCDEAGIDLMIVGITDDVHTTGQLRAFNGLGIDAFPLGVDTRDSTLNNLPYDSHPNEQAHQLIFTKVNDLLANRLSLK